MNIENWRRQERTGAGVPTIPVLPIEEIADWLVTDIMIGEWYMRTDTDPAQWYTRWSGGIMGPFPSAVDLQAAYDYVDAQISGEAAARLAEDEALNTLMLSINDNLQNQIGEGDLALQANIDALTLEDVRSVNNILSGDIDFNGHTGKAISNPVDPGDIVNLQTLEEYISETNVFDLQGEIDCSTNPNYPAALKGMRWEASVEGKIGGASGKEVEGWDEIVCKADNAGGDEAAVGANWYVVSARVIQATETYGGTAELATQAETDAGIDDLRIITPLKIKNWWINVKTLVQTFAAKITFTSAPRFDSVNANEYLKSDGSKDLTSVEAIPAADITQDSDHRFATDAEKALWNSCPRIVAKSTTSSAATSSLTEVIFTAIEIPANYFSIGDTIVIKPRYNKTGAAGNMVPGIRIHTSAAIAGNVILSVGLALTNVAAAKVLMIKTATNTEEGNAGLLNDETLATSSVMSSFNINWGVIQYIMITGRVTNAADSLLLGGFSIWKY